MNENERLSPNGSVAYIDWTQVPSDAEKAFIEACNKVALILQKKSGFICLKLNREIPEGDEINWFIYTEWKSINDLDSALVDKTFCDFLRNWSFQSNEPLYNWRKGTQKSDVYLEIIGSTTFSSIKSFLLQEVSIEVLLVIAWLSGIVVAIAILFLR